MKSIFSFSLMAILIAIIISTGCNTTATETETTFNADSAPSMVTNPILTLAPTEYSDLCEQSLQLLAKGDYDRWAGMLADDVIYAYPDGDMETRTEIKGKTAVVDWWKKSKKSGTETMALSEFNHIPINVTGTVKGGAPKGIYDIVYFNNKLVINGKPIALRMNFSVHFNDDKKIDRYYGYYDRSAIINAAGKNALLEADKK